MSSGNYFGGGGYGVGNYGGEAPIFSKPLAYYLSLIPSQYQNSPKFLAFVKALLAPFDDVTNCLYLFSWAFDLNNAVGDQLDIIGQIVGAARHLNFQPRFGVSAILDDATYRILILATIARNQWDGQTDSLQAAWLKLFPGGRLTIIDNQNMTFDVLLSGTFTTLIEDLITNDLIVPRPETVLCNYIFATLPIFGFDFENAFIAGFDTGEWS